MGVAKVRAFFISAKNIWNFFQNFLCLFLCVLRTEFFCRTAKIQRWSFLSNGIRDFFGISFSLLNDLMLFSKAGAKIRVLSFTPNVFEIFPCFYFVKELFFFQSIEIFILWCLRFDWISHFIFFSNAFFKSGCKDKCVTIHTKYFSVCYRFCFVKELTSFCEAGRKDKFVMFTSKSFLIFIIHKRWNKDVACVSEEIKFFMFIQYVKKIIITLHIFFCMQLTRRQLHRTFQFL